jgi:hypothetical protein
MTSGRSAAHSTHRCCFRALLLDLALALALGRLLTCRSLGACRSLGVCALRGCNLRGSLRGGPLHGLRGGLLLGFCCCFSFRRRFVLL